ncbi:CocE/NonD family hydrolase [Embleya sp. NPDC127516]|uniref:CocE/NonD family hydrolase n=1 Tax=Embleya sp. NPDC127516 TaxID=3363990 RepID=UPI0037F19AB5
MSSQEPQPTSLYPELDEATLTQVVEALETGNTGRLAPARVTEVEETRAQVEFSKVRVPGAGGDELDGALWLHRDGRPRPLIVMPSPWVNLGWVVYAVQATRFALKGYHVLAYTARGFGESQGEVEVAGLEDIEDGQAAITFVEGLVTGELTGVGFIGDSYGSGISQLVAAEEPKVGAVVALSTWGDLGEAFFENGTRHLAAVSTLLGAAADARLSETTQQAFRDVLTNPDPQPALDWAVPRSPHERVGKLNERRVPILFANAWHETLFPTNQTLKMFNALTGPKRLLLSIGDHSGPESPGIIGLPNRIWEDAHRWFDHHLKGIANGIDAEGEVVTQIMWKGPIEERPTWGAVTGRTERLYLTGPQNGGDGTLTDKAGGDTDIVFRSGADTPATVANKIIFSGYPEMAGFPKVYPTNEIDRSHAGVWATAPLPVAVKLRGVPRLRVTYTIEGPTPTVIAHLFDVDADGNAHIITHAPFTGPEGEAERLVVLDIALQATGYNVPAGHRVLLVLDTFDPFYGAAPVAGTTITVSPSDEDPSYLDLPVS